MDMRLTYAEGTKRTLSSISHFFLPHILHRIFTIPTPEGVIEVLTLLSGGPIYFSI
jgi:hypothetical protein